MNLHSKATGDRFTRGGLTTTDGAISSFANSGSLTSGPTAAELRFISSRNSQVVRLWTNSPECSALCSECLRPPLANIRKGGLPATALKKL